MKKSLITLLIIVLSSITVSAQEIVLKAGISLIDQVPKQLFGVWSVQSKMLSTDSPGSFSPGTVDVWNLKRTGNVLELSNPMTGAVAQVNLTDVEDNKITFSHWENAGNVKFKDTVTLILNGDSFSGTNELYMESESREAGKVELVKKSVKYTIVGKKISGSGIELR